MSENISGFYNGPTEPEKPRRNSWPMIIGITVAFFVVLYLISMSHDSSASTSSDSSNSGNSGAAIMGDIRTIRSDNIACTETIEKYDDFGKAAIANDKEGMMEALSGGVALMAGTKVRAIDQHGFFPTIVRLRVLNGEDNGRACWTEEDPESLFK
jgi:hypothetical protein